MSQNIRGITVEIGASTKGLQAALGDVNKKSKDLTRELAQVEKLLKLDPTNTELLSQKQKLLADAIANSGDKLNRLKTAQEQVNEQFKQGTISEVQYRAFSREVVKAEQELAKFNNRLEETQQKSGGFGFGGVGENLKGMLNPATLAAGAVAGVGAAAVGVAAEGVKMAMSWDESNRKMAAATGLPVEAMEGFGDQAEKMYAAGRGGADEIYEAMTKVQRAFQGSAEETGALTEKALVLQQAFGYDVSESIRAVDAMVKNFGVDGNVAFDIISKAATMSGDKADDLLDTFNEYSVQFASMGFGAEEFAGILVKGAQAGAFNLDKVADAMKEFNVRAQDGSETTAEGFALIGLNAEEMGAAIAAGGDKAQMAFEATIAGLAAMKDPLERNKAGAALFGTQWEDVRSKVVLAMVGGKDALGDFAGATDDAASKVDGGLGKTLERVQKQFGLILKKIGEQLIPILTQMAEWIEERMPEIEATIETTFTVMGKVIEGATLIIRNLMALLQGDFTKVMDNTLHFWGTSWDEIKGITDEAWGNILITITDTLSDIVTELSAAWLDIKTNTARAWADIVRTVTTTFSGAIPQVVEIGKAIVKGLWDGIQSMGGWIGDMVSNFISNLIKGARDMLGISSPSKVFAEIGKNISLGMAEGMANGTGNVKAAFADVLDSMTASFNFSASKLNPVMAGTGGSTYNYNSGGNTIVFNVTEGWGQIERELHRRGVVF